MPLDPTFIAQGVQPPDIAGSINKWGQLGLLKNQLALSNNQVQLSNETLEPSITTAKANASTAVTGSQQAAQNLSTSQAQAMFTTAGALATHPAVVNLTRAATDATDPGQMNKAVDQAMLAIRDAQRQAEAMGVPQPVADVAFGHLIAQAKSDPAGLQPSLIQRLKVAQGAAASSQQMFPAAQMVPDGQTVQPQASGNPALTGVAVGTPQGASTDMQLPVGQQETIAPNPINGNMMVVKRDPHGRILGIKEVPGAQQAASGTNPSQFPPGEDAGTLKTLRDLRLQAAQNVGNVGIEHNLNQAVFGLADKTDTSLWGKALTGLSSLTGFNVGGDIAANRNTMGKFLARSAAADAQTMNLPHTNAGAAQADAASGTIDYDPTTLKRISVFKEGMTTGKSMFQQGLDNAVNQRGDFAARPFIAQWGNAFDPTAAAYRTAVDSGNKEMQSMIIKEAGGLGSPGMKKILLNLLNMRNLAGESP